MKLQSNIQDNVCRFYLREKLFPLLVYVRFCISSKIEYIRQLIHHLMITIMMKKIGLW